MVLELQEKEKKLIEKDKTLTDWDQIIKDLEKKLAEEKQKREDAENILQSVVANPSSPQQQQQTQSQSQLKWWNLRSQTGIQNWESKGNAASKYSTLKIIDNGQVKISNDDDILKKLRFLLPRFGTDISKIKKAHAISSPLLLQNFENNLAQTNTQHRMNPHLFKKNDWIQGADSNEVLQRFRFWYHLHQNRSIYDYDASHLYEVLPMLHGCDEQSAAAICETGFAFVGASDPGYFGQGMYFTTSLRYGLNYAKRNSEGLSTFLICLVAPGNPYPVVEQPFEIVAGHKMEASNSLVGKPCRPGYQSHFTIVDRTTFPDSFPIKGDIDPNKAADELIVFQDKQVMPLFLIAV